MASQAKVDKLDNISGGPRAIEAKPQKADASNTWTLVTYKKRKGELRKSRTPAENRKTIEFTASIGKSTFAGAGNVERRPDIERLIRALEPPAKVVEKVSSKETGGSTTVENDEAAMSTAILPQVSVVDEETPATFLVKSSSSLNTMVIPTWTDQLVCYSDSPSEHPPVTSSSKCPTETPHRDGDRVPTSSESMTIRASEKVQLARPTLKPSTTKVTKSRYDTPLGSARRQHDPLVQATTYNVLHYVRQILDNLAEVRRRTDRGEPRARDFPLRFSGETRQVEERWIDREREDEIIALPGLPLQSEDNSRNPASMETHSTADSNAGGDVEASIGPRSDFLSPAREWDEFVFPWNEHNSNIITYSEPSEEPGKSNNVCEGMSTAESRCIEKREVEDQTATTSNTKKKRRPVATPIESESQTQVASSGGKPLLPASISKEDVPKKSKAWERQTKSKSRTPDGSSHFITRTGCLGRDYERRDFAAEVSRRKDARHRAREPPSRYAGYVAARPDESSESIYDFEGWTVTSSAGGFDWGAFDVGDDQTAAGETVNAQLDGIATRGVESRNGLEVCGDDPIRKESETTISRSVNLAALDRDTEKIVASNQGNNLTDASSSTSELKVKGKAPEALKFIHEGRETRARPSVK